MPKNQPNRVLQFLSAIFLSFFLLMNAITVRAAQPSTNAAAASAPVIMPAPTNAGPAKTMEVTEADKLWIDLQRALRPPPPSPEWGGKPPSQEQQQKYFLPFVIAAADKAKTYYTKFPNEPMAPTAKMKEHEMLEIAISFGATNLQERMTALEKALLADPKLSDDMRFQLRANIVTHAAMANDSKNPDAAMAALEKGIRELQKDFPKRQEIFEMLLDIANNSEPEKAKVLLKEIIDGQASPDVKAYAQSSLKKLEMVGKPISINFAAVDGRAVDVAKMHGKVVLVDFWATWCGPCRAALPEVKEVYKKYHGKGLEIVGIDLDDKKETLEKFLKDENMEWPQYFDGLKWGNKISKEFQIESIPTMWLVDKKGNLRDTSARVNLAKKVEKLLAE